jgi:hypothetical protein
VVVSSQIHDFDTLHLDEDSFNSFFFSSLEAQGLDPLNWALMWRRKRTKPHCLEHAFQLTSSFEPQELYSRLAAEGVPVPSAFYYLKR